MIRMTHRSHYEENKVLELIQMAWKKCISRSLFNSKGTEGVALVSDDNIIMLKIFGNVQNAYHLLTLTREIIGETDIKFLEDNILDPDHKTVVATWFKNPAIIKETYKELNNCCTTTILHLSQRVAENVFGQQLTQTALYPV